MQLRLRSPGIFRYGSSYLLELLLAGLGIRDLISVSMQIAGVLEILAACWWTAGTLRGHLRYIRSEQRILRADLEKLLLARIREGTRFLVRDERQVLYLQNEQSLLFPQRVIWQFEEEEYSSVHDQMNDFSRQQPIITTAQVSAISPWFPNVLSMSIPLRYEKRTDGSWQAIRNYSPYNPLAYYRVLRGFLRGKKAGTLFLSVMELQHLLRQLQAAELMQAGEEQE